MSLIIAAVLFGLGFAYLATQNTAGIALRAGPYLFSGVPIYLVVFLSLLAGLIIAWAFSSVGWVSSAMQLRAKDNRIRETESTMDDLQKKIDDLKTENRRLRGEVDESHTVRVPEHETADEKHAPNLLDKLRNSVRENYS
jgi:MFS superfamily sulfate permease-like transporter